MTKDEALKMALEALENGKKVREGEGGTKFQPALEDAAMTAIEEALAQPEREWVGLTDEDMDFLYPHGSTVWVQETVKNIEAKLKDKNT